MLRKRQLLAVVTERVVVDYGAVSGGQHDGDRLSGLWAVFL